MADYRTGLPSDQFLSTMLDVMLRNSGDHPTEATGVHANTPYMTPKYAKWDPARSHEFKDTMARMFIKVDPKEYQTFLNSLTDPISKDIAKVLTGDNAGKGGVGYVDFFLQSAKHQFVEKMQVSEVLSDNYVAFFFGHQAPVFNYSGTLMNTFQDDWTTRMYRIFRDMARGTQLARTGKILHMRYDSYIVSGAMVNLSWNLDAGRETYCDFSFDLLVKNMQIISGAVSPPTKLLAKTDGNFAPDWVDLSTGFGTTKSGMKTYAGAPPTKPGGSSAAAANQGAKPENKTGATGNAEVKAAPAVKPKGPGSTAGDIGK
jgi:hypothetical protein